MSIRLISRPLQGERVLQVSPEDAVASASTWKRRPNLFPGRALTAPTLDARSAWAAGRVAQRGQAFTPGVVQGLDVGFEARGERGQLRPWLLISSGRGLCANGEDVVLVGEGEVAFDALPVVAPPGVFGAGNEDGLGDGVLAPRVIGPSLGALSPGQAQALPRAGVLVLQPVTFDRSERDEKDPCDHCACGEGEVSYEDWRVADGARLLWYAWPEDWAPLPPSGELFRNRLAHAIFEREAAMRPEEFLPWDEFGVALGVVAIDDNRIPQFVDRAAAVRLGGRARHARLQLAGEGRELAANPRLPALWQARMEQLAGQVTAMSDVAADPARLARAFDRLPPCGLLPRSVIDWNTQRSPFFPAAFELDAVPVPTEQLDLALRAAASMEPIDFSRGERVRVLVPVSQASFEPGLLQTETLDPLFATGIGEAEALRSRWLAHRQGLRTQSAILRQALDGQRPALPALVDDPQALEAETLEGWGPPAGSSGHRAALRDGAHFHAFDNGTAWATVPEGATLFCWVFLDPDHPPRSLMLEWRSGSAERRAYWGENRFDLGTQGRTTRLPAGELPATGRWLQLELPAERLELVGRPLNGMAFHLFDGRAAFSATGLRLRDGSVQGLDGSLPAGSRVSGNEAFELLSADGLLAPFEAAHGIEAFAAGEGGGGPVRDRSLARQELIDTALGNSPLSNAERARLDEFGVAGLAAFLAARADRVDDLIDVSFVRVRTDLYRLRQLVLDSADASRLAVSPALADIARADTAVATRAGLSSYAATIGLGTPSPAASTAERAATEVPASTVAPTFVVRSSAQPTLAATSTLAFDDAPRPATGVPLKPAADFSSATLRSLDSAEIRPLDRPVTFTPLDIGASTPLVGKVDLRSLSIAERMALPKASEARDYAAVSRYETVAALVRLADEFRRADDNVVSGLFQDLEVHGLVGEFGGAPEAPAPRRALVEFINASNRDTLLAQLKLTPERVRFDEAAHFADSAELADRTIALLRQIEGRVRRYRELVARCEAAAGSIRTDLAGLAGRERVIGQELVVARHDLAVMRALLVEEQARVDGVNARRKAVLEEEVRFVAFLRPRTADTLRPSVSRPLVPGLLPAPVPECLQAHDDVPAELEQMLRVLREAPAGWFRTGPAVLGLLDRTDLLLELFTRSQLRRPPALAATAATNLGATTGIARSVKQLVATQGQQLAQLRSSALRFDVSALAQTSWRGLHDRAAGTVSLGDVIDGDAGRGLAARRAAEFLERVSQVCGCLHAGFSEVVPAIRFGWAETLSQYDATPNLRNLSSLSRWGEIDFVEARRLQGLVDWLFDQVDGSVKAAVALASDVVRMCLLLASHAPIGRIVAGRLPRPMPVRPGLRIPIVPLDLASVRIGMQALVFRGAQVIARARIEDLSANEVSAMVLHTEGAALELLETDRVQFSAGAAVLDRLG